MSRFDELVEFRFANRKDIPAIMDFIGKYWSSNHILATNRDVFEYEFCNGDRVGAYIAVDRETGEILALQGFYYYSEKYIPGMCDLSGGMYLAKKDCKIPMIGAEVSKRSAEAINVRTYVSPGVNPKTAGILIKRLLQQEVGKMEHYYRLANVDEYRIARIIKKPVQKTSSKSEVIIYNSSEEMYQEFDDEWYKKNVVPYKDKWYVNKRYFNHFKYNYLAVRLSNRSVMICRIVEANGSRCLRIMDILGDKSGFDSSIGIIDEMMNIYMCEYADIYEAGMDSSILENAGFIRKTDNDPNIIPNYFEPFLMENIDIYYHRSRNDAFVFKADGDQDRPNYL